MQQMQNAKADYSLLQLHYHTVPTRKLLELRPTGDVEALCELGFRLRCGIDCACDEDEGWRYTIQAARIGHPMAIGRCYDFGKGGVSQDFVKAVEFYRECAERNYAPAMNALGACYECGEGVTQDRIAAVQFYERAHALENAMATKNLGVCYQHGNGIEQNPRIAFEMFSKAAEQNHSDAFLVCCVYFVVFRSW
jgi:TPR repeat protein